MAMHDMSRAKGFPCKECDLICPSTPSLLEHMKAHYQQEESGRFECEQCGRVYKHANSLANHKKSHEVGSFQCPVCTRTLPNAVALKNHLRIHTLSPSAQAEEENEDGAEDERDYSLAQDLSDTGFRGHIHNSGMMGHDHDGQNDKQKSSGSEDAWDRPFKCDQCDRTYRHHGSLVNHKKSHQEGAFKCTICYKQFSNLAALNAHERTHSKFKPLGLSMSGPMSETSTGTRPSATQNDDMTSCYCHLCQVALPNKNDFQEHILLHNAASSSLGLTRGFPGIVPHNLSTVRSSGVHPYSPALGDPLPLPPLPDKRYDQMLGPPLNNPMYTCAYCGAGHPDLESLKVHYLTHDPHPPPHVQEGPSILNSDGLGSNSQPSVSSPGSSDSRGQPSSAVDDADRRFKCQECGKSYRHAGSLVNHKRCHQTGQYQCTVCCKQYPHLAALHSHLRSHKSRPSSQSLGSEGDWLSSEPLTLDSQQGFVHSQDQESAAATPISLPGNLGDAAHFVPDGGHSSGLDSLDFHDRFDGSLAQGNSGHSPVPQNHRQADRQPQGGIANGFIGSMGFHSQGSTSLAANSTQKASSSQRRGQDQMQYNSSGSHSHGTPQSSSGSKRMDTKDDDDDDGEVYQCSVCGNHYASLRALRSHLRSHSNIQVASQVAGPSAFSVTGEQEWRRRQEGSEAGLMICSTCGQSFSRKQDLLNHQLVHGPPRPDASSQGMGGSGSNANGKMDGRNHICVDCGMFFADRHHLITHLCPGKARGSALNKGLNGAKGMTGGAGTSSGLPGDNQQIPDVDRPHRCDQCGRSYRHPCSLLNHKKSHKTGVFRCLVCQKRYYNLLALKNHQRTHFDLKRHKCEECGKAFKIQKQLINHLRLHEEHRAKTQVSGQRIQGLQPNGGTFDGGPSQLQTMSHPQHAQPQQTDDPEGRRPFACDQCGRTYRHAGSLANHKNLHKTGEYHCNVCNSTYPNRLAMKNHLRMHFALKKYTCTDCGRGFRTQRQLDTHTANQLCKDLPGPSVQVAPVDYECNGCGEGFGTSTELTTHNCRAQMPSSSASLNSSSLSMDTADLGSPERDERPFTCDLCGCSYKHASSLLNHKNTHKTGNFSCSYCDKPYSNYMALRNHMRIHTQKKRHICNTCGKAFRLARFLRNHQRVHEEGHTRFGCPSCGKSFQGRSGLARHRCGENQVGNEGRRKAAPSTREGEECRFTYMISNPASLGPYACRNSDFSEVWTV
uniref:C2H2-type domain-containing protein n=1 Tax=Denticeps clupeoides TaxID=299321 RepID=A0AAY4C689_9TELE